MIKAIALDDEPPALNVIKRFCADFSYIELLHTFTKVDEAANYLAAHPVDLLFLDIRMPSLSGIEFKKRLDPGTMVIFTTAYSEFALEGFNLNVVDYLLKPFTPARFRQAVEKAKAQYGLYHQAPAEPPKHLLVRADYSLVKIEMSTIDFVEGLDDYIKIHLDGGKPILVRMTLKAVLEKLPPDDFLRVHRSFIVALKKITSLRKKTLHVNGKELPVGASFEARLFKALGKSAN